MVYGLHGDLGAPAPEAVAVDRKQEPEHVPTLRREMEEITVQVQTRKEGTVTQMAVQFTVAGLHGDPGAGVPEVVVLDCKQELEHVQTLLQVMEEQTALV